MERLTLWMGTGLLTAGVTAAMLAGAGLAAADSDAPSSGGTSSSEPSASEPAKAVETKDAKATEDTKDAEDTKETTAPEEVADTKVSEDAKDTTESAPAEETTESKDTKDAKDADDAKDTETGDAEEPKVTEEPTETESTETEPKAHAAVTAAARTTDAQDTEVADPKASAAAASAPVDVPATPAGLPSIVAAVGNVAFGLLSALEQLVNGYPALPAGSTVTVHNSPLQIAPGYSVAANWYFPEGDTAPDRLIVLQHGFLAIGPMYSYTAANLAQETGAIVVTPTLLSNFFAGDGLWLGGDAMHRAIANLFYGDRAALNTSANLAGYAERYGLDPETATLPLQFGLAGHSLGGALVSGVSGYLAENGAADNLVGTILLDGVPIGDQLPDALQRLADYQDNGGKFVPVREIGAPWNLWNSLSNVNPSLIAARPDNYKGVVLDGGVHMDSMQGGNPLIQFLAFVAAGFPQPQNPPAVQALATQWFDSWFSGNPYDGDDLVGGSTITIGTDKGDAHGVVIGTPVAARLEDVAA